MAVLVKDVKVAGGVDKNTGTVTIKVTHKPTGVSSVGVSTTKTKSLSRALNGLNKKVK